MDLLEKRWAITGATGSLGRAWTKWILERFKPISIRGLSRDELKQSECAKEFDGVDYILGDVRDQDRVRLALRGVDFVIHAAALKRIEKGERDPQEFIKTNIQGSVNVINGCLENGVNRAILISTDKAAAPTNLYGATKMVAEKAWVAANSYSGASGTDFVACRYGNVANSRGSVIPIFQAQAKADGPFTITDSDMTRFHLTLGDACNLVTTTLRQAQRGDVFVPKCKSYLITDLAKAINPDKAQAIVGTRGGEKIHETLITDVEAKRSLDMTTHYIIRPEMPSWRYEDTMYTNLVPCAVSSDNYALLMNIEEIKWRVLK